MDAGFTPTITPYQLHYSTYIQLTWSRLDMNDEGGLWPSALKTFYLYWREWDKSKRFCLITVTRLLLGCFYFFPNHSQTCDRSRRAQTQSPSRPTQTHWTVGLRRSYSGGGGRGDRTILVDWATERGGNAHWAITACLLWNYYFIFLYFYFYSFLVTSPQHFLGGNVLWLLQLRAFKSNGMFKWLTLENIHR